VVAVAVQTALTEVVVLELQARALLEETLTKTTLVVVEVLGE
jgi:hypothetical protein